MFESHITVIGIEDAEFVSLCRQIGVKPIIIDRDTGSLNRRQMMTAKFHFTNDQKKALAEMHNISANFCVVRHKLEYIVKWGKEKLPDHKYLEFHTKYELQPDQIDEFIKRVSDLGGHSSCNVLKQDQCYYFMTARTRESWKKLIDGLKDYNRINTIMECVVYDDSPDIDSGWSSCGICCNIKAPSSEYMELLENGQF